MKRILKGVFFFTLGLMLFPQTVPGQGVNITSAMSSPATVTVPADEWQQMQSDMKAIRKQLDADKEKAAKKKAEEDEKKFSSPNTKLSARFYLDGATATGNDTAEAMSDPVSGSRFREIRLTWKGSMYEMFEYALSVEFSGSDYSLKDVYGGFYNLPCGIGFRAGHFKEPWSMEELMGTNNTPLMEKSFLNSTKSLVGGRNTGFMFHNWHRADRLSWAVGVFAASMGEKGLNCFSNTENVALTARMTFLPYYVQWCDGRETAWHVGLAYSCRKFDSVNASKWETKLSFKPDSAIQSAMLDTGAMTGLDTLNALQIESALVHGSFTFEFEQAFLFLDDLRCEDGEAYVQTGFVQFSYILTGEGRNYRRDGGFLGGVTPDCPFLRVCTDEMSVFSGPGAWEIAYRLSWVDTGELATPQSGAYLGYGDKCGFALANTVGLNWYLTKNVRMMFNYSCVKTDYDGTSDGKTAWHHVFATRFQMVF